MVEYFLNANIRIDLCIHCIGVLQLPSRKNLQDLKFYNDEGWLNNKHSHFTTINWQALTEINSLKFSGCNQCWSRYDLIRAGWHMSLTPGHHWSPLSPALWHCHHVTGPRGRTQETPILFKIHFGPELVRLCPFIAHQLLNYTSCPQLCSWGPRAKRWALRRNRGRGLKMTFKLMEMWELKLKQYWCYGPLMCVYRLTLWDINFQAIKIIISHFISYF